MSNKSEEKIFKVFKKVFKFKKKSENKLSPQNINGWDSLGHLKLIAELNKTFKIDISFEDTIRIKNLGDIYKICKKYIGKK